MIRFIGSASKVLSIGAALLLIAMLAYYEWTYIRDDWLHFFNPVLHLMAIARMLVTIEFWVLAVLAIGGAYVAERVTQDTQQ